VEKGGEGTGAAGTIEKEDNFDSFTFISNRGRTGYLKRERKSKKQLAIFSPADLMGGRRK